MLFVELAYFVLNFLEFIIELKVLRESGAATEAEDAEGQDQEHREELESYVGPSRKRDGVLYCALEQVALLRLRRHRHVRCHVIVCLSMPVQSRHDELLQLRPIDVLPRVVVDIALLAFFDRSHGGHHSMLEELGLALLFDGVDGGALAFDNIDLACLALRTCILGLPAKLVVAAAFCRSLIHWRLVVRLIILSKKRAFALTFCRAGLVLRQADEVNL